MMYVSNRGMLNRGRGRVVCCVVMRFDGKGVWITCVEGHWDFMYKGRLKIEHGRR
jgi:hypothetical protein